MLHFRIEAFQTCNQYNYLDFQQVCQNLEKKSFSFEISDIKRDERSLLFVPFFWNNFFLVKMGKIFSILLLAVFYTEYSGNCLFEFQWNFEVVGPFDDVYIFRLKLLFINQALIVQSMDKVKQKLVIRWLIGCSVKWNPCIQKRKHLIILRRVENNLNINKSLDVLRNVYTLMNGIRRNNQ